jgi:hypothetical protein
LKGRRSLLFELPGDEPTVEDLVTLLGGVQDTFNTIGRYLLNASPDRGPPPRRVKEELGLLIKDLSLSSPLRAEVCTRKLPVQATLGADGTLGEGEDLGTRATEVFTGVTEAVNSTDIGSAHRSLHDVVEGPEYRRAILAKYRRAVSGRVPATVTWRGRRRACRLDDSTAGVIDDLSSREEREMSDRFESEETIKGALVGAKIVDRMHLEIDGVRGDFDQEVVDSVMENFGHVVEARARVLRIKDRIDRIVELRDIKRLDVELFETIEFNGLRVRLSRPLEAVVGFREGAVWLEDGLGLNIIGTGRSWKEAVKDFESDFNVVLEGYVGKDDDQLSQDAIGLRDTLRELVPGWRDVLEHVKVVQAE